MHTDEYEISLSREIDVCVKKVSALREKLFCLEKKFNMSTGDFATEFREGRIDTHNSDYISWFNHSASLDKWQETLKQYQKLFFSLKD